MHLSQGHQKMRMSHLSKGKLMSDVVDLTRDTLERGLRYWAIAIHALITLRPTLPAPLLRVCLLGLLVASPAAMAKEWSFDVFLDKQKIGSHRFVLDAGSTLKSEANFNVKVLFINAYSYHHRAEEEWKNDCLTALTAHTVEKKQVFDVVGVSTPQGFEVTHQNKTQLLPACTMTFAYWNPKILTQSHLLNPQNAEYLSTNITKLGAEKLEVRGQVINTTRYKIEGALDGKVKLKIDLWYDSQQNWVGLKSTTPEGYEIYYKLK